MDEKEGKRIKLKFKNGMIEVIGDTWSILSMKKEKYQESDCVDRCIR